MNGTHSRTQPRNTSEANANPHPKPQRERGPPDTKDMENPTKIMDLIFFLAKTQTHFYFVTLPNWAPNPPYQQRTHKPPAHENTKLYIFYVQICLPPPPPHHHTTPTNPWLNVLTTTNKHYMYSITSARCECE